ncbi:Cupredoxin [Mycotypha africana]|uniref:Cupredoxin n=1 Tax=Mycotypha africana TaxID=64632 RepID=UPI002300527C|nr:Cupredoxin [Mycotypha africana]KAI8975364.1 Cupredoxin [Mycotypha africana]
MKKKLFLGYLIAGSIIHQSIVTQAAIIGGDNSNSNKRYYEFNVTSEFINPDCHHEGFSVPVINGQFPGPTIYATKDDEIEILVRNMLTDRHTSVHFHGIRMIGTPEADGVPNVTQEPILPGESHLHKFRLFDQSGTFFYHAHVGLQDDSVKGAFIVYESNEANPSYNDDELTYGQEPIARPHQHQKRLHAGPYSYDEDRILQISEWWHESLNSRENYYMGPQFQFDHGADSILMNGRTVFQPEKILQLPSVTDLPARITEIADRVRSDSCEGYATFDVEPNKTYRLRVIGSNSFRTIAFGIKDHNMTLIEVDGELTEPFETSYLEVSPGQRYSVLLNTGDFEPGTTFAIGTHYMWRQRGRGPTENGFGFIRYVSSSNKDDTTNNDDNDECDDRLTKRQHTLETHRDYASEKEQACFEGRGNADCVDHSRENEENRQQEQPSPRGKDTNNNIQERESDTFGSAEAQGDNRNGRAGGEGDAGRVDAVRGSNGSSGGPPGGRKKSFIDVPTFPQEDRPDWFYHEIQPLAFRDPIIDIRDDVRTIKLATSYGKQSDNTTRYFVNGRIGHPMSFTAMKEYLSQIDRSIIQRPDSNRASVIVNEDIDYNEVLGTYRVANNEVVDLVFQNTVSNVGSCLLHPWHTHGHSHYVIASGEGDYIHDRDKHIRNFRHPLYRDTTVVYPSKPENGTKGCGWTKVRILANNPGFWAVHCHITTHMLQGKMIILETPPIPYYQ